MKVLVSLLTEKVEDIHLARRKVAYDRLVLVVHPGAAEIADQVARAERDDDVVQVVEIEGRHVHEAVQRLRKVVRSYGPEDDVTLNAAGGHAGLVTAMILLAYEEGLRTLFVQESHVAQLPVLEGVQLEDRLSDEEKAFLSCSFKDNQQLEDLADSITWSRPDIERVCRSLEHKGLGRIQLSGGAAAFDVTRTGEWVREHLKLDTAY